MFLPTPLLSDSTGALSSIARDPVKHEPTTHIGVDASYTRAHVRDDVIELRFVSLCPRCFSWQISSLKLFLFVQTQSLRPPEFEREGAVRYMCVFLYFHVCYKGHVHIWALALLLNTTTVPTYVCT